MTTTFAVVGRPGETWTYIEPRDETHTGWHHGGRPYMAVLALQVVGRQPGYVARVGVERIVGGSP